MILRRKGETSDLLTMNTKPPCPLCKTNKHVANHGRDEFFCSKCRGLFDSKPDEGGAFYTDPVKNAERREEFQNRQRQRR
jgi:hypothetical protein